MARRRYHHHSTALNPSWIISAEPEDNAGDDLSATAPAANKQIASTHEGRGEEPIDSSKAGDTADSVPPGSSSRAQTTLNSALANGSKVPHSSPDSPRHDPDDDAVSAGSMSREARKKKRYAVQHSTAWVTNEPDEATGSHHQPPPGPADRGWRSLYRSLTRRSSSGGRTKGHTYSPGYDAPAISPSVASNYTPPSSGLLNNPRSARGSAVSTASIRQSLRVFGRRQSR